MEHPVFAYVVLPSLIFMARIFDVSLDTIRVILVTKGFRKIAPFVGFFQILIWIFTITRIMQHLDNWVTYIGYAAGFATGTWVGMILEQKIALGYETIRVITRKDASALITHLREFHYTVTFMEAEGRDGKVNIFFVILKRKNIPEVTEIIREFNPNAFYTIEDVRFVSKNMTLPVPVGE